MEEIYNNEVIHQTIVISGTEESCIHKLIELRDNDHTVSYIHGDSLDDERPLWSHKVHEFARGSSRVLLMSYFTWFNLMNTLEEYVMDRHNLMVLHNLDSQEQRIIATWIRDVSNRGFLRDVANYHILVEEAG